jgi:aspartyl-tRNA(Asn)/glutamyl-tRNA(Gln) amidotransferase subunit B
LLGLISSKKIHGKIAKQVLEVVFNENKSPVAIVREHGWEQLTTREEILPFIRKVMGENSTAVKQVQAGDAKPVTFLVGKIMAATAGRAEPQMVQLLLGEELALKHLHVLLMGGAITARKTDDGIIVPGDENTVRNLFASVSKDERSARIETVNISSILSEDICPADWARLVSKIAGYFDSGSPRGIVVTHGTDTLAYTAALVYWLFPAPPCPIVFASSAVSPATEAEEFIVRREIERALGHASTLEPGVYVACGDALLSPLNLKFEKAVPSGFRNINTEKPSYKSIRLGSGLPDLRDNDALASKLEKAADSICVLKLFPGMRNEIITSLMGSGITRFILELYGSGTANTGETDHSIRNALIKGRDAQVKFYCTSQTGHGVDFSGRRARFRWECSRPSPRTRSCLLRSSSRIRTKRPTG